MKLSVIAIKESAKYIVSGFGETGHEELRFTAAAAMPKEMLYAEAVKRAMASGHTVVHFEMEKS